MIISSNIFYKSNDSHITAPVKVSEFKIGLTKVKLLYEFVLISYPDTSIIDVLNCLHFI